MLMGRAEPWKAHRAKLDGSALRSPELRKGCPHRTAGGEPVRPRFPGGVPIPLAKSSFKNLLLAMRLRGGGVVCEEPGF